MSKTILVVDDEELLTRTFTNLLSKEGYDVLIAKSGSDALDITEECDFKLVVCDIRMPGINGVETVGRIRDIVEKKAQPQPRVIFITGYADREIEAQARTLDPEWYLFKPFDVQDLLGKIRDLMAKD